MTALPARPISATSGPLPADRRTKVIRKTLVLQNRLGLHCRPAALLIKALEGYSSKVMVEANNTLVNARSILGLMTLSAAFGTRMTFIASGPDAVEALAAVENVFQSNFAEAYAPA